MRREGYIFESDGLPHFNGQLGLKFILLIELSSDDSPSLINIVLRGRQVFIIQFLMAAKEFGQLICEILRSVLYLNHHATKR